MRDMRWTRVYLFLTSLVVCGSLKSIMGANSKLQAVQSIVQNTMNATNASLLPSSPTMEKTFDNLYPALLQCFAVILIGYCTGRMGLITPTSSKGIGVFISHVSLPALLFKSMAGLNFSSVNWLFLASILIAKSIVFITVAVFTLVLARPRNYGRAGLFAIFATQSNDFALGYPLREYFDARNDFFGVTTEYPHFWRHPLKNDGYADTQWS